MEVFGEFVLGVMCGAFILVVGMIIVLIVKMINDMF